MPNVYILPDSTFKQFYIAGEIPDSILTIKDETKKKRALEAWGKKILALTYKHPEKAVSLKLLDESNPATQTKNKAKNKLMATAFPVILRYADRSAVSLDGASDKVARHVFLQVGDATITPNFFKAHGLNDAFAGAKILADNLDADNSFQIDVFNAHHLSKKEELFTFMAGSLPKDIHALSKTESYYKSLIIQSIADIEKEVLSIIPIDTEFHHEMTRIFLDLKKTAKEKPDEIFEPILAVCDQVRQKIQTDPVFFLTEKEKKKYQQLRASQENVPIPRLDRFLKSIKSHITKVAVILKLRAEKIPVAVRLQTLEKKTQKPIEKVEALQETSKQHLTFLKQAQKMKKELEEKKQKFNPPKKSDPSM